MTDTSGMAGATRESACDGKDRFPSRLKAKTVAKRMTAKGRPTQEYRCQYCGSYHVGGTVKGAPKRAKVRSSAARAPAEVAVDATPERRARGTWAGNQDLTTTPIDRLAYAGEISSEQASAGREYEAVYAAAREVPAARDSLTTWEPRGHDGDGEGPVEAARRYRELSVFVGHEHGARLWWVCVNHTMPPHRDYGALREALNEAVRFFQRGR
jgi:hypothetical protein